MRVIPAGGEAFVLHADLERLVVLWQAQRRTAEDAEVRVGMSAAQTRFSEAWLSQALAAVKEHGPVKAAAYFRSCLVNGLTAFTAGQAQIVGGQDRGELAALYRRLESLVPISDEQIRRLLASMSSRERGREQASSG